MTDKEYYVAELVEDYENQEEVELTDEELEAVAELQNIHRKFDLSDYATEESVSNLSDEQQRSIELIYSEFIRRGRKQSDEKREELLDFFNVDKERLENVTE